MIVQVVSFKLTGKRVFMMAPIHHHFEQKGWTEPQIVIRFWIISIVLALVGTVDAEAAVTMPLDRRRHPVSFAGRKVALFGLGASGLAGASALLAGGADVVAFDDERRKIAKASRRRHPDRDLRDDRLVEDRSAGAHARRAAHASGAALDRRAGAQCRGRGDRRHRAVLPRAARASRRRRRSSPSPAPTASRPRRRCRACAARRPATTRSSAAISAPRSCRSRRRRPAART